MGVFLILMVFIGGLPAFDFTVFQSMKECLEFKVEMEQAINEGQIPKPIYLECKSAPAESQPVKN
jgi:hypothetical protein